MPFVSPLLIVINFADDFFPEVLQAQFIPLPTPDILWIKI
jgi:hypothetical protein